MITWLDGGFLFELNKEYGDLGQEAVLNAPEKILFLDIWVGGVFPTYWSPKKPKSAQSRIFRIAILGHY